MDRDECNYEFIYPAHFFILLILLLGIRLQFGSIVQITSCPSLESNHKLSSFDKPSVNIQLKNGCVWSDYSVLLEVRQVGQTAHDLVSLRLCLGVKES